MKYEGTHPKALGHRETRFARLPFLLWELIILGIAIGIILASPVFLFAQTEVFGYFETEYDAASARGYNLGYGYHKLRVDLLSRQGESVTIGANLNGQLFYGETVLDFLDFLPERVREEIDTEGIPFQFEDSLELDNAFVKLGFRWFDLTAGKQQIALGTGYAWNPLDIFNRKELIDPTYEQSGITAIRLEVPIRERLFTDIIVSPDEDWDTTEKFARIKLGAGSFDFVASAGLFRWDLEEFGVSETRRDRIMLGGAAVGEVWEIGFWAEGAWNEVEEHGDFEEFVVGLDHTFDFQTYVLFEYYHNGSGERDKDEITIDDYYHLLTGGTHSLMQDYLFLFARHPASDLISIGLLGFGNFNDSSFALNPLVEWSAFENIMLSATYSHFFGDDDTEFGQSDWGVRLRLKAYF